jgi:hypothetical protein
VLRTLLIGMAIVAVSAAVSQQSAVSAPRGPPRARIAVWLDPHAAPGGAGLLVERALATWTRAADGRLALQKTTAEETASIRIRFVQADGIYGEAAPRIDRVTGYIGSAEVVIAGEIAGDALQQRIVIYLTALHELGHALGLPHTAAFDDIMYSFRRPGDGERYFGAYRRLLRSSDDIGTDRATGLSPADVAALKALYDK